MGTTSSTSNSIMGRGGGYLAKETPTETPEKAGKNRGINSSTQQQKPGDKTSRRRLRKRSEGTDEGVDSNIDIHNSTLNVGEKRPENDGRKRARRSVTAERNDEPSSSSNVREGPPAPVKGRGKGKKPAPTTTKARDTGNSSEGKKPSTDNIASEEAHSLNSQQNEDGSTTGESIRDSPPTPSEETIPGVDPFAQFFFNKATWQAA